MLNRRAVGLVLVGLLACHSALAQKGGTPSGHEWTIYRNDRFRFWLEYPADVFQPARTSDAGDGQVFVAGEGEARLLVGALPNGDRLSPAAYQNQIARQSYGDYVVTYRRVSGNWFALSGEGHGKTFYEKVIFSCRGRLINSFAIIYPSERASLFDPIVEGIEKSFRTSTASCHQVGSPSSARPTTAQPRDRGPHTAPTDRIARSRGTNVIVALRRRGPPYDYKTVRGYAAR